MTTTAAPLRQRRPVLTAVLLLLLHGVVAFVLIMVGLSLALTIGGPTIGRDELSRMGPALPLSCLGALLPLLLAPIATLAVAITARGRTWIAPLVSLGASVLLWGVALLFLHPPEPVLGG
ncbi:hypothetical protein [uncultured Leifsonia sp.]|uniref:hypothetical protein n=1 Tax=uncultured Leifsonia sp. TaxID=340359 RepID=UPI0028D05A5B|nr:hypothetical protein [uncultured Leifsonia sp.]